MKIKHAKTIEEAIDNIQEFFEADMWYAKGAEWKEEKDMLKYLKGNFDILRKEIKKVQEKKELDTPKTENTNVCECGHTKKEHLDVSMFDSIKFICEKCKCQEFKPSQNKGDKKQ